MTRTRVKVNGNPHPPTPLPDLVQPPRQTICCSSLRLSRPAAWSQQVDGELDLPAAARWSLGAAEGREMRRAGLAARLAACSTCCTRTRRLLRLRRRWMCDPAPVQAGRCRLIGQSLQKCSELDHSETKLFLLRNSGVWLRTSLIR